MKKNIFFCLLLIYFLSPSIIIAAPTPPVEAKECKSDNYERCFWLGYFNQSKKLAAKISLHRGCKKKNEVACFSESYLDYRYSTLKDESLIMKLLSQGCFDGIALSCALLGRHQEKSPGNRIYFDSIKELYSLSCEQKNSFGCANLGEYLEKKETTKWTDVEPWYIRACYDGIAEYCRKIGDHFQNSKQNNLAGHWLGQACNLDRSHCFTAGFFEERFGEVKHAKQYYAMICYWEQRDKNCDTLLEKIKERFLFLYQGGVLVHSEVGLLPEDPMGIQLSILCNKTWGPACDMLGEIEKQRGNKNDALKYNHLACDKGEYSKGFLKENPSFRNFEGCYRLGKM